MKQYIVVVIIQLFFNWKRIYKPTILLQFFFPRNISQVSLTVLIIIRLPVAPGSLSLIFRLFYSIYFSKRQLVIPAALGTGA